MTYYETWDEMDPRTNELTTATDAPPAVVLVRVEEYDRLRDQNADLLGQLDAVVFAHNVMQSERDRLREALAKIEKHPNANFNVAIVQKEAPTIADIARAALQEVGDEPE